VNIQSEEPAWFETLYRARGAQLLLYGRALGLSHAEAEDVLQETFIALMERESAPTQPEHYCVRAYRNRALNYRRSLWRRITREFESLRWFEATPDESKTERQAMERLASLPQDQREVIVLKIWHQYTFEEIGELLEVSPNTAAGRYRYGLQKLRTSLMGVDYEQQQESERERQQRTGRAANAIAFLDAAAPLREN
jgi:RNA polymerase sigma-70 factor (ECF subfamily)